MNRLFPFGVAVLIVVVGYVCAIAHILTTPGHAQTTYGLPPGTQQYSVGSPVYITPQIAPVSTATAANTLVLKASPGQLFSVTASGGAAVGYAIVQNSTTAATTGTVAPVLCAQIPANSTTTISLPVPAAFSVGISVSVSSVSCYSMTGSSGAFISGQAQ